MVHFDLRWSIVDQRGAQARIVVLRGLCVVTHFVQTERVEREGGCNQNNRDRAT